MNSDKLDFNFDGIHNLRFCAKYCILIILNRHVSFICHVDRSWTL